MPFYEILFETGHMTILHDGEPEMKGFVIEHDRRARSGEPGGPIGQPAERIAKIYEYETHPNDYNVDQTATAEQLNTELPNLITQLSDENGVVSIDALAQEVRGLSHPMVTHREGAFDSMYKMEPVREVPLDFLSGEDTGGN